MKPHVLVVDDEEQIRRHLDRALRAMDFRVSQASNGAEAWASIRAMPHEYHMVLTDLRMPEMDGQGLLERMRAHHPDIPVAIITGHGDVESSVEALRQGAFDFLTKPFGISDLARLVKRFHAFRADSVNIGNMVQHLTADYQEHMSIQLHSRRDTAKQVSQRMMEYVNPILRHYRVSTVHYWLCVCEAVENAVVHGNMGIDSSLRETDWSAYEALVESRQNDPEFARKLVKLDLHMSTNEIVLSIEDQGGGFVPEQISKEEEENEFAASGRGIFLIRNFMDDVSWDNEGRRITMRKKLFAPLTPL